MFGFYEKGNTCRGCRFLFTTNYSRHLEEIAKETERQTLATVQDLLMEEKLSKAVLLLEYWEEYLSISEIKSETLEAEVELFLRRISKLEGLLKELYLKCNSTSEGNMFLQLVDKCSRIYSEVNKDRSLSAGGRFEWVNSVLVKSLQEGSWLLVDNVNLCSAAVLDRLNALLEPNGVLTISEKGVDENGQMFEVKPHKDFRIFLTMDPQNGEISRAMRNRGVEIYMLNETEIVDSKQVDLKSLIDFKGLSEPKYINALLNIHQFISGLILRAKPGNTDILQCSSLISQQIKHGIAVTDSFYNTCIEVYYKTRCSSEFNCNNVLEVIKDGIKRYLEESNESETDWYNKNVTLRTRDLVRWSDFEKVKHQAAMYRQLVTDFRKTNKEAMLISKTIEKSKGFTEYVKGFRHVDKTRSAKDLTIWSDLEVIKHKSNVFHNNNFYLLANLLSNVYAISSIRDLPYRTLYLKNLVPLQEFKAAIERFDKAVSLFRREDISLPVDYRWTELFPHKKIDEVVCNSINVAMQVEIQKLRDMVELKLAAKQSLYQYLLLKEKNAVSDIFNSLICNNYLDLRNEYFVFLRQLTIKLKILPNDDFVKLLELLSWRQALQSFFTSVKLPESGIKNPMAIASKLNTVTLYYKWFYKYSVLELTQLLKVDLPDNLQEILSNVNKEVEKQFSPMYKVSKNFKKFNNVPEPFKKEWQLLAVKLIGNYDLTESKIDPKKTLSVFKNNPELRKLLVKLKCDVYSDNDSNDDLAALKAFHEKKADESSFRFYELEMLPLVDNLTQILLRYTVKNIESGNDFDLESLSGNILVPVELNGVLLRYKETGNRQLIHEIRKCYYLFSMCSASVNPNKFKYVVEDNGKRLFLSGIHPTISYIMNKLLVQLEDDSTTLSNFRDVQNQQRCLGLLLWNNMHSLSNKKFDYVSLQLSILKSNVKSFLGNLQESLKTTFYDFENVSFDDSKLIEAGVNDDVVQKNISNIFKIYGEVKNASNDISTNDLALLYIADLHILLGFTQAYINSYLPSVDPLAKKALKKNHISSVINMFDQMKHSFELQNHLFSNTDCSRHPYYESIKKIINELEEKVQEYGKNDSVGFKTYPYSYVVQQIHHAFDSVLNITILSNVIHCTSIISDLRNASLNGENYDIEQLKTYINRIESNVPSFERIFHDWKFYRSSYPDIVEPLLANVSQFLYGLKLKLYLLKRELLKYQFSIQYNVDLETELLNLATLPSLNENVSSLDKHAERYTGDRIRRFIDAILDEKEAPHIKATENLRLLKCGIQECFNQCVINTKNFENTERELLIKFKNLVNIFVDLWNMQQEKREQEKIESESLYKTRTKCDDKSEEEQIKEELMELFPNHHELDFCDLQKNTLTDSVGHTPKTEDMVGVISEEDLKFVIDLHATLFRNFIKTEWLCPESGKNIAPNFVTPLMEKYKLVRRIMDGHVYSLKYTIDAQLSGSLAVLLNVATHYGASNDLNETSLPTKFVTKEVKDFYKDSDVEEVKSCYHVLEDLKIKVNELLQRWSDQPTLNTILTVIERILNFNITSPVSRFLTGFDILLAKCHEWEEVAHSGVSLIEFSPNLINQIITWRKMELGRWKDLLNSTFENLKKPLSKWWLYMFNLMHQFVIEKKVAKPELIETIQKFMTTSNLVEFQGRLEIIFEFHCHAVTLAKTPEAESFINILWNLYNYFHQFSLSLNNKIKDLRAPIEKKLKEYVKIVKWKDVSYWAIKDTVDKSHKTLHKFIREYKDVLLQPVLSYLANPVSDNPTESVGIWDRPQRQSPKAYHYSLDADSYIVKASTKDLPYLSKARKICKETIHGTDYPVLVQSLDTFVTDVIETSAHLRNLEVDTSLPKEKQKSQAKNILQQKHRALAELFQNLTKIGVSYRSGIMDAKLKIAGEEFIIKPIDLSTSFGHLSYNRIDEKIFTIWDSCEMYYYRCLMRFDVLQTSLTVPARDLGIHNIERCRGFAAHLLTLCQEQKRDLVAATRSHYYLRNYAKQIRDCCENVSSISTSVLLQLQDALNSTSIVISQFKLILNSCPEEHSFDTRLLEIPILDPTSRSFQYKNDEIWDKAMQCIGNVSSVVSKIVTSLQKSNCSAPCTGHSLPKRTYLPYSQKTQLIEDLQKLVESISKLKEIFIPMKFSESLDWLVKMFIQILDECNKKPEKAKNISSTEHQSLFENFTKIILIVFQNLYKKYREASIIKHERTGEDNEVTLQENHLKSLVMQNLSTDIESLEIEKVLKLAKKILSALIGGSSYASECLRTSASQCLPILDQIVQLSQYFITQQVATYRTTCKLTSILLNVFIDLASKGFCVPPELSDEIDKEGISKPSDGMGLGEGQGEKDVSDKIESEDQLDDAKPAGQEQENTEDPDCTEEDKGIEMSEDFDSKLQDKKTSGEDEENNESENSDAEEQMGETEKGADQLDREIWGSDKEDDGEGDDDTKQKEEKGEGGENEGEDQLGSNEDNSSKDKSKNKDPIDGQNEEKENSKKDINDMHEPEYDDEQTDPYHGNQPELPEPEPMDLPDDLQLDDGEENNGENPEENPFNIDEMKEQLVPDDKLDDSSKQNQEEGENDEEKEFSSDDEDITKKEGENLEGESADQTEEKKLDTEVEEPRESREGEDQDGTSTDLEEKALDQNPTNQENVEAMEVDEAKASDKTQATQSETLKSEQPIDELCQEDKPDKEGVGQSQMEKSESGHSLQTSAPQDASSSNVEQDKQERKKEKPGESDSKRSLGNVNQSIKKKLKTMDATTTEDSNKPNLEKEQTVDMYQHIKEATDQTTTQILDAATKEQAEEQRKEATHKDSENEDEPVESSTDVPAEKEEKMEVDIAEMKSEKQLISESKKEKIKNKQQHPEGDVMEDIQDVDIEGEIVKTATVPRGTDSFHHTQYHLLQENTLEKLTQEEVNAIRVDVEKQLSSWKTGPTSVEAEMAWQKISSVTSSLAQDLSEQLRLVLEPTQASHLKGDFRTGRRINMRKVIPYIASQFRKDKIWLRRTKPSKREYQIVLAIDDSSSMADNHSKELAFESVALVSKALSLLESGQLSVASFGEKTEVHHKLTDPFTDKSGVQLLQNFHFDQQKTCVGKLVNFVTEMFEQAQLKTSIPNAKLLLIVSDGRGVFSEGKTYVTQAVRRAKLANVFVVFIIIDSPENKNSILDIRSTVFKDGQFLGLQNYMDDFPFSFYIILRDINSLPGVLSDALMQWFEMVISQQ